MSGELLERTTSKAARKAAFPPERIGRPSMEQDWDRLSFISWPYDPSLVQRLLPAGLEVETREGAGWVSVIPFRLRIRVPAWAPRIPWATAFPEMNLRTYVTGPDGTSGIWFLSLDASRLLGVLTARAWYRLPYTWARIRLSEAPDRIEYRVRRRSSGHPSASIVVEPGEAVPLHRLSAADLFLTARFRLWSPMRGGFGCTTVDHPPWRLCRATAIVRDEGILAAAGLPPPEGRPHVAYSEAMHVRFGPKRFIVTGSHDG